MSFIWFALAALLAGSAVGDDGPWPAPVAGFSEPKAGEHPRLFFRKADVPGIRRRAAETPEGRAITARLRMLLGDNGESMPAVWNPNYPINIIAKGPGSLPIGAFTMSHAAGFGMLYQLTGQKKYADLARQCLERMFDPRLHRVTADVIQRDRSGQWEPKGARFAGKKPSEVVIEYGEPDRDERYTWTHPGAGLRVGPMMVWVALAYDLCYDAWDEAFRLRVVKEIIDYNYMPVDYDKFAEGHKGNLTMDRLVDCSYPPESNHFGAYIGGAGTALLAVRRDPGADEARVERWLARIEKQALRLLTEGFGDHGFFAEGHGPSRMAAATAFIPFLQAARTAWGKDFVGPRPNAQWIMLRWPMEIVAGEKPWYPNYYPSSYGADYVERGGEGYWSLGFGALCNDEHKAAMLWTYLYAFEREPAVFDAEIYPHHALMALVNWPIGLKPRNPGEVIGHVNVDGYMGHYMFRKQWRDENDLYFSFFLNPRGKHGYVRGPRNGNFAFYGLGIRCRWSHGLGTPRKETHFQAWPDGSGVLSFEHGGRPAATSIAVDYGEKSGVDGVVVIANPWFAPEDRTKVHWNALKPMQRRGGKGALSFQDVTVGGVPFFLMLMHCGEAPRAAVEGDTLKLGGQTYRFDGSKLLLGR